MKKIISKVLEKFLICITICIVFSIIVTGKIAVEESGRQMIDGIEYASAVLENNKSSIDFYAGEKLFSFDKGLVEMIAKVTNEIKITPFGAFLKTVDKIIKFQ